MSSNFIDFISFDFKYRQALLPTSLVLSFIRVLLSNLFELEKALNFLSTMKHTA